MLDTHFIAKLSGGSVQRRDCLGLDGSRTSIRAERQRHQRVPEQETLHFGERKHTYDLGAPLGKKVMRSVAEAFFDDFLPPDAMEESSVGASVHEFVPTGAVFRRVAAHADRDDRGRAYRLRGRYRIHATPKTTRSIRSQRKSCSSS